jgi:fermentation-respiration switch protein FrsA (DUF1100 family)
MMKALLIIIAVFVAFKIVFIFLEQKSLYHPTKEILNTPESLGIGFENVVFKTSDGQSLNGWFVPAQGARVTVLYCHGNAGTIADRLHKVTFFNGMGVNFFIFDYRGYGKSTGRPSEKGLYRDAQAAYDYLLSRGDVDKNKIVAYGKSLGGPVAADVCSNRNVSALILEGSFASVLLRARQMYPFLPMQLLVTQRYDAMAQVKRLRIPKLIVHGRQDDVIAFRFGEMLFAAAVEPKQFLPFEGGHNDDVYVVSPGFRDVVLGFLKKYALL